MFQSRKTVALHVALGRASAIDRSQAVIEFANDGTILSANQNFLDALGYRADELSGKHHKIFMPADVQGDSYRDFWARLGRGEFQVGAFRRLHKSGRDVWIQASYNPVLDAKGRVARVVKFATDITAQKLQSLQDAGKISAIDRSQAVIEFNLDGTIITANANFLACVGYALNEIVGRHHSMFCEPAMQNSTEYCDFWRSLNRGEFQTGEYKRRGKDGRDIWLAATYSAILDADGKPLRVIKFASDITAQKERVTDAAGQLAAIDKSQAVIEFAMDGTILHANANFLAAMGYALADIQGQHHSMFVSESDRGSDLYRAFWQALNRGEYQAGEFRRVARDARDVWIQASYNPIVGLNGKPCKVVKYASDTTLQVVQRMRNERIRIVLESVAGGAEELNASVREIATSTAKSSEIALEAVKQVESADHEAQRLRTAAQAMTGIVEMIGNITGQINLLALNATIESARAGDAGRGFAVVATEVKNLATQAKQATDRIGAEIGALTAVSTEVACALGAIKAAIQSVGTYATSTAAAIEQQSAVTAEMSSSMKRAAAEAATIGSVAA